MSAHNYSGTLKSPLKHYFLKNTSHIKYTFVHKVTKVSDFSALVIQLFFASAFFGEFC